MSEIFYICGSNPPYNCLEYCITDCIFLFFCVFLLTFSVFALYKMCKFYKRIKFENLVISGGIIEIIIIIFSILTAYEILNDLSHIFKIFISLYIIRRLVRIVRKQYLKNSIFKHESDRTSDSSINDITIVSQKMKNDKFHTITFIITSIINGIIGILNIVACFCSSFAYMDLIYCFYSLSTGVALLVLGVLVISRMKKTTIEIANNIDESQIHLSASKESETFFKFRQLQIYIVIITNLMCNLYQNFFIFGKYFYLSHLFKCTTMKILPISLTGFILIKMNQLSNALMVLANLISFFTLIYKQFNTVKVDDIGLIISNKDIKINEEILLNRESDVNDFLKKSLLFRNRDSVAVKNPNALNKKSFLTTNTTLSNLQLKE